MRGLRDTAEVTKIVVTVAMLLGWSASLSQWVWDPDEAHNVEDVLRRRRRDDHRRRRRGPVPRDPSAWSPPSPSPSGCGCCSPAPDRRGHARRRSTTPTCSGSTGTTPSGSSMLAWALGSMLAVLAGVLIAPDHGGALDANALTLLVIDAFAAAMFGRLRSIPRTFVGAIVLGLAATYVLAYVPTAWTWTSNLRDLAADDPAVRRPAGAAAGPAAGRDVPHPGALPGAERPPGRGRGPASWSPSCTCYACSGRRRDVSHHRRSACRSRSSRCR